MTQATNTFDKYDVIGNREDLSDMIYDVSPTDTPIMTAIRKGTATNTLTEWQTDALASAAANAHIEGDDNQDADALTATTRLNNQTQILKKKCIVSGTQEKGMNHAGVKSEMAYQKAKKMKEIKIDAEFAFLDNGVAVGNAKVAGNATTAREMATLATYLTSNGSFGAGGAAATGDGTDVLTAGTDRDFTEALLTTALSTTWTNGGDPTLLAVSAVNKAAASDFAGGSTRYIDTDTKQLMHTFEVYVGDFHTLKIVPCRQLVGDNVYGIDPEYLEWADLRPLSSYPLAKTGDNFKEEMVWEGTIKVRNEAAHFVIADTNG